MCQIVLNNKIIWDWYNIYYFNSYEFIIIIIIIIIIYLNLLIYYMNHCLSLL
ncbi:MAG: hypothetical protein N7Q72_07100 [Spiroplasma sp. Tabriz.8]|nr:hypothetical protein [Spiroplasma sp. Tabriz.8]